MERPHNGGDGGCGGEGEARGTGLASWVFFSEAGAVLPYHYSWYSISNPFIQDNNDGLKCEGKKIRILKK